MPDAPFAGLPEITLALRALGSRRVGRRRADEERFFSPLIAARRDAADAKSVAEVVRAFDTVRLTKALDDTIRELALERHAMRPPARRALEAELADVVKPVHDALAALAAESALALAEPDSTELWERWVASLRATFEAADRVWIALDALLTDPVPPPRPWWRRLSPGVVLVASLSHIAAAATPLVRKW